jgi:hypothetical protein
VPKARVLGQEIERLLEAVQGLLCGAHAEGLGDGADDLIETVPGVRRELVTAERRFWRRSRIASRTLRPSRRSLRSACSRLAASDVRSTST